MAYWTFDETEIYYEEIGEGIPFLLIHGWAIDHAYLQKALEPVFSTCEIPFHRIYVDLPGMGLSKLGKVRRGDEMMELLYQMMEDLTGGSVFNIGGNSFGAGICRAMAAKHGEKIGAMMLLVPSAGVDKTFPAVKKIYQKDEAFLQTLPIRMKAVFSLMNANLTKESYERFLDEAYPSMLVNADNPNLHGVIRGSFAFDVDAAARKALFDKPVLILSADCDTTVGYERQKTWLPLYPNGSYRLITGAGHNVHVDQPEQFYDAVLAWVNTLSP